MLFSMTVGAKDFAFADFLQYALLAPAFCVNSMGYRYVLLFWISVMEIQACNMVLSATLTTET